MIIARAFLASFLLCSSLNVDAQLSSPTYQRIKTVSLGRPDRWDYVIHDADTRRVYVAHYNEIAVLDAASGDLVGAIKGFSDANGPLSDVNGVAIVSHLNKGYTASRSKQAAVVFDLRTLKVLKEIPAGENSDGLVFDKRSGRVFVVNGAPRTLTVLDPQTDTKVGSIDLGGTPDNLVSDGRGRLYINIKDKREVLRIDAERLTVEARWPIGDCEQPHGIALDDTGSRVFSSCWNRKLKVLRTSDGTVEATVPIGAESDGVVYDARRRRVLSSNGEGSLTIIKDSGGGVYRVLDTIPTQPLTRTMAIVPATGRLFLATADAELVRPDGANIYEKYKSKPGTAKVLIYEPI